MAGKILIIVFAVLAGAGAVTGYQLVMQNTAQPEKESRDQRIEALEERLSAVQDEVQKLDQTRNTTGSDVEALAARLNTVDKQLSEIREERAKLNATAPQRELTGEQLVRALRDLPPEGRSIIRKTMRQGEPQVERDEPEDVRVSREKLELELSEAISKLKDRLELTPMQMEDIKVIGRNFVDTIVDAASAPKTLDDPTYPLKVRREMEQKVVHEIVKVLTPYQLDKWRDMSDDIERLYPRDR